ncbi:MAG: DUF4112 domain-containing protein [Lewinellaceae bacterium]|nr:DUF4112 domain-containing protein [Lewinellaceae bacterium]
MEAEIKSEVQSRPELERLAALASLMDNRFRIPGTNIRFGLDAIIGLVPYVGDIVGLLVSGFLMLLMVRQGAGPLLLIRMMGNYLIDASVGTIPFLGDIFDIGFKANRRNVDMLIQYYEKEEEPPNAIFSLLVLVFLFLLLLVGILVLGWWVMKMFFGWVMSF